MYDKRTVALFEAKELVTNPLEVMHRLLLQRNTRAESCVDKNKITARKTVLKTI